MNPPPVILDYISPDPPMSDPLGCLGVPLMAMVIVPLLALLAWCGMIVLLIVRLCQVVC